MDADPFPDPDAADGRTPSARLADKSKAISTILVVDDSRLQRKILTSFLKRWGFEVLQAESGADALDLCRGNRIDLILSDWVMPGMTGIEFCRELRAMGGERYIYFILLTSKSEKEEVAKGLESGADDFVTKPIGAEELRARINAAERILKIERELTQKNVLITQTLAELQSLYAAVDRDLNEARKLQHSLLKDRFVDFGSAQASLLLRSCGHVGGDLVGHFRIDRSHIGLYSIDVSGHGIASALMTARLAGYLSGKSPDQNMALVQTAPDVYAARDILEVGSRLNHLMLSDVETEHYFTMLLAYVNVDTGDVEMLQAGHPHPLVQRADGSVEAIGDGGMPIGLLPDALFGRFDITLRPGDRLLLGSDGITECENPAGDFLGDEGLIDIMTQSKNVHGEAFFQAMLWDLTAFAEREDMGDDVSGVLLEFKSRPGPDD